jgi:hypothetical protein
MEAIEQFNEILREYTNMLSNIKSKQELSDVELYYIARDLASFAQRFQDEGKFGFANVILSFREVIVSIADRKAKETWSDVVEEHREFEYDECYAYSTYHDI